MSVPKIPSLRTWNFFILCESNSISSDVRLHLITPLSADKILPSEKAFSYKMKLDAIKRQTGSNDFLSLISAGDECCKNKKGKK